MNAEHAEISVEDLTGETGWMRAIARQLVRDEARADDLVSDMWLAVLTAKRRAGDSPLNLGGGNPRAWVRRVLRNLALTQQRSDRHSADREHGMREVEAARMQAAPPESGELEGRLGAALGALPSKEQEVLKLRYYEDLSPRAIARRLEIPVASVHTCRQRGLDRLRQRLDAEYGERRNWCVPLIPLAARHVPVTSAGASLAWMVGLAVLLLSAATTIVSLGSSTPGATPGERAVIAAAPTALTESIETAPEVAANPDTEQLPTPAPEPRKASRISVPGVTAPTSVATLEIQVRSSGSGQPLPGAEVTVSARDEDAPSEPLLDDAQDLMLGAGGSLRVPVPSGVPLLVRVSGNAIDAGSGDRQVEPLAAGESRSIVVELPLGGDLVFWGRALDTQGQPLVGHPVHLLTGTSWTWGEEDQDRRIPPQVHPAEQRTHTDDTGLFRLRATSWDGPMVWIEGPGGASALIECGAGFETPEDARVVQVVAPAALYGHVIDGSGRRLPDARVELWSEVKTWLRPELGSRMGKLEDPTILWRAKHDRGEFRLDGLPAGVPFEVVVTRSGEPVQRRYELIVLEPGEAREVEVVLGGRAAVAGVALDSTGEPVANLDVWLVAPPAYITDYLSVHDTPHAVARTDAEGRFIWRGLAAGTWWIAPAPRTAERPPEAWAAPRLEVVELAAGDTRVEVRLTVHRGLYLRGTVIDAHGVPAADMAVSAHSESTSGGWERTISDGTFELGPLEPGPWTLSSGGAGAKLLGHPDNVVRQANREPLVLQLNPGAGLRLKVRRAGEEALVQATVAIHRAGSRSSGWGRVGGPTPGIFEYNDLPSGTYTVFARTEDGRFGELRGIVLRPGEVHGDVAVSVYPAATLLVRSTGYEDGAGWEVLRGSEALSAGFARPQARTAVPAGRLVIEHWPLLPETGERQRIEFDIALGETLEIEIP